MSNPATPIVDTTAEKNGAFNELDILVKRLCNLGVSHTEIAQHVRKSEEFAAHDGTGLDGK